MKNIVYASFVVIALLLSGCKKDDTDNHEKAPDIKWEKTYGGSDVDALYAMKHTADNGYILYGQTLSNDGDVTKNFAVNDIWLVKIDAQGQIEWQNTYGGSQPDMPLDSASDLVVSNDGGYLITGYTGSDDGNFNSGCSIIDGYLMKIDHSGNIQWVYKACGNSDDYIMAVTEQNDGSVYVVGNTASTSGDVSIQSGNLTNFIMKFSSTGAMQWIKYFGGSGNDMFRSIKTLSDGNLIITGASTSPNIPGNSNDGSNNIYLAKLSSANGSVIWQKCIDYGDGMIAKEDKDGNIVILANNSTASDNHGATDLYVVKTDSNGNILDKKSFGGGSNDFAHDLFITDNNDYLISGEVRSNDQDVSGNNGQVDMWLVKLDNDLKMKWQKCLGSPDLDAGYSVSVNNAGNIAIAGYVGGDGGNVSSYHGGMLDYWICVLK